MSRYIGPKLKIVRRLGLLPGLTSKKSKKLNRPGKDGNSTNNNNKSTEYGIRLEEKQKLRFNYGLNEKQLFKYVQEARRRKGVTGLILLQLLETRLDIICFRLGFGNTIAQARQLVNHGHILVNNKMINIPSFQCQINNTISVKNKNSSQILISKNLEKTNGIEIPHHLKFNSKQVEATVLDYCNRADIQLQLDELLVIEYYSRK